MSGLDDLRSDCLMPINMSVCLIESCEALIMDLVLEQDTFLGKFCSRFLSGKSPDGEFSFWRGGRGEP